jgi:hypothetical protein
MKLITILLLTTFAAHAVVAAHAEEPKPPADITKITAEEKAKLSGDLLDYGMWREQQDRDSFPKDMPKVGEPYDWATGNAIRETK